MKCVECEEFKEYSAPQPDIAVIKDAIAGEMLCSYHIAGHPTMAERVIDRLWESARRK